MEIKDYLIKQARLNNVCFEGYNIMRSSDINGLVHYYKFMCSTVAQARYTLLWITTSA